MRGPTHLPWKECQPRSPPSHDLKLVGMLCKRISSPCRARAMHSLKLRCWAGTCSTVGVPADSLLPVRLGAARNSKHANARESGDGRELRREDKSLGEGGAVSDAIPGSHGLAVSRSHGEDPRQGQAKPDEELEPFRVSNTPAKSRRARSAFIPCRCIALYERHGDRRKLG